MNSIYETQIPESIERNFLFLIRVFNFKTFRGRWVFLGKSTEQQLRTFTVIASHILTCLDDEDNHFLNLNAREKKKLSRYYKYIYKLSDATDSGKIIEILEKAEGVIWDTEANRTREIMKKTKNGSFIKAILNPIISVALTP